MKVLLSFFMFMFIATSVYAQEKCVSPSEINIRALAQDGDVISETIKDKGVVDSLLEVYNLLPPVTQEIADTAVWYSTSRFPTILVVFFNNGCSVGSTTMPRGIFHGLVGTNG